MLRPIARFTKSPQTSSPFIQSSTVHTQILKENSSPVNHPYKRPHLSSVRPNAEHTKPQEVQVKRHAKRNELGVQLLSRELHSQIFRNISFPPPNASFIQIAREHLKMHGLDPAQGSLLPDTGFQLPPLQGSNLLEHFHRIGAHVSQPWLDLAKNFTSVQLPPKPDHWEIQSGWTKYVFRSDGAGYSEHVPYPMHDGKPENMLTFDVETMPPHHPYAVMACAASENAWYAWISPWLLGESSDTQHLVPLGDPSVSRVIVGHNVSYDRGRILEEYNVEESRNRFIDTMALHVAVKGISSHQRPAWMKYRKSKETELERQQEAVEAVVQLIQAVDERIAREADPSKKEELERLRGEMSESLYQLQIARAEATEALSTADSASVDVDDPTVVSKRWEDITSANSLADVAKLHCGIHMDKQIRSDFMDLGRTEILADITDYLEYCANDVYVTHRVYSVALPAFLQACPHPVSFAGILTMGSSFLTVNQEWEAYIRRAEKVYQDMQDSVQTKLKKLAEDAKSLMDPSEAGDKWKDDPWLSQLDWTPKIAGKSRGIILPELTDEALEHSTPPCPEDYDVTLVPKSNSSIPQWYSEIRSNPLNKRSLERILPLLLRLSYKSYPLQFSHQESWHIVKDGTPCRMETAKELKTSSVLSRKHAFRLLQSGDMTSSDYQLAFDVSRGDKSSVVAARISELAEATLRNADERAIVEDPWLKQLKWKPAKKEVEGSSGKGHEGQIKRKVNKTKAPKPPPVMWPKWYWDATKPKKGYPPGTLEITVRNRIAPLLLRLSWQEWPLFHSREHGWSYRVPAEAHYKTRATPLSFYDTADKALADAVLHGGYRFYKLPHKDGEEANVGSPLAKTFMKYAQDGTLKSPGDEAKEALDMNTQCSYWISARDRILNQMVVWQNENNLGFKIPSTEDQSQEKWGIILPQVITMGTVTRRAIEKTWLTASNAKKNRVGSELKAMVRAPPGYAIVGADVDSEELWISSCMGDAQFGLHGATAIGWMTLEGTKAAGTDLHSKTASILGISRDQAKVFNYSRIYGAGMRHAMLLLLQSNAGMLPEKAQKLAENLYASTKGKNTHRQDMFGRKFWFGGTESFVFNKLEEIALSDKPQTPALGCGVTYALSKEYLPAEFGSDYMPSRINWVVQSSGVDYLHLLIVSMSHLIEKYNIRARYLISVHDELRYLVKEEDRYRAALALQIANLWTRCMFAYKLGMDDLPQGVAFFSAVDVDKVLRKEVDMPCVTPSQPNPIPPGESLDIASVLSKTNGGSLWRDGRPMSVSEDASLLGTLDGYMESNCLNHRANSAEYLRAQATNDFGEVKGLAKQFHGITFTNLRPKKRRQNNVPLGNGEGFDWSETVERLLREM
ncbi:gamma DNA-directed DNA polymerase [Cyathus striatus]|nr:gamma DNA-directed DNA polymerase [Cyathus striatus]